MALHRLNPYLVTPFSTCWNPPPLLPRNLLTRRETFFLSHMWQILDRLRDPKAILNRLFHMLNSPCDHSLFILASCWLWALRLSLNLIHLAHIC